jgi:CRP-like cAMP-binding protein
VSLSATFSIFMGSNFSVISEFGSLCAIALFTAMIADLIVTPVFLRNVHLVGIWDVLSLDIGVEALMTSPLFKDMTKFQIKKTILLCNLQEYVSGDMVIKQGSNDKEMYVLLNGTADVTHNVDGKTRTLANLKAGDVFGEAGFSGNILRTASVVISTNSKVVALNKDQVEQALRLYPNIATKLYRNVAEILGSRLWATLNDGRNS